MELWKDSIRQGWRGSRGARVSGNGGEGWDTHHTLPNPGRHDPRSDAAALKGRSPHLSHLPLLLSCSLFLHNNTTSHLPLPSAALLSAKPRPFYSLSTPRFPLASTHIRNGCQSFRFHSQQARCG